MIANLITTLLLALGVATGNVSSNSYKGGNAFNHVEKKPIQKAVTTTEIANITKYIRVQRINNNNTTTEYSCKYYYADDNELYGNPNYYNPYMRVYNTTYTYNVIESNDHSYAVMTTLMQIDNYMNTSLVNLEIRNRVQMYADPNSVGWNNTYRSILIKTNTEQKWSNYIDQTLTTYTSSLNIYEELEQDTNGTTQYNSQHIRLSAANWVTDTNYTNEFYYTFNNDFTIQQIDAHSNIQILIQNKMELVTTTTNTTYFYFYFAEHETANDQTYLRIEGVLLDSQPNYEVVDIPNLMFTILTLPFAWYSTAFNLTIFPGTPYQVNFGNIIMIIVAASILFYLIKKVIK